MTDTTQKQRKEGGITGKGFVKGDKRINRLGRPKSFDALRKLAQKIAAEELQSTDGDVITRIEALLRVMSTSRNPADRKTFLEYAFGKPKEEIEANVNGGLTVKIVKASDDTNNQDK